jgi:hypothetical protein
MSVAAAEPKRRRVKQQNTVSPCLRCPGGRIPNCFGMVNQGNDVLVIFDEALFTNPRLFARYQERLQSAGLDPNKLSYTSTVKCVGKSYAVASKHCRNYISWEIQHLKPKVVITFGKRAVTDAFKATTHDKLVGHLRWLTMGEHSFYHVHAFTNQELEDLPERALDDVWALSKAKMVLERKYPNNPAGNKNYRRLATATETKKWLKNNCSTKLGHNWCAFDIEAGGYDHKADRAVGTDPWHPSSFLLGVSICTTPGGAVYVDLWSEEGPQLFKMVYHFLKPKDLIAQNGKFDINFIKVKTGFDLSPSFRFDTMLADHLLHEYRRTRNLKYLASRWLSPEFDNYEAPLEHWFAERKIPKHKRNFADLPPDMLWRYACCDADVTMRLMIHYAPRLEQIGLTNFMADHVMRMSRAYSEMEFYGWGHDFDVWKELKETSEKEQLKHLSVLQSQPFWPAYSKFLEQEQLTAGRAFIDDDGEVYTDSQRHTPAAWSEYHHASDGARAGQVKKTKVYTLKDITPSPDNDKFKRTVLFNDLFLNLPVISRTKKKKEPQVDSHTLRKLKTLQGLNPDALKTIDAIMGHEILEKRLSTYLNPAFAGIVGKSGKYAEGWRKADGLVHGQFMMAGQDFGMGMDAEGGTNSGRISARAPNMTNFPTRKGGKIIKRQFVAARRGWNKELLPFDKDDPWDVLQLDYSQLELRILTDLAQDDWMVAEYQKEDSDLHSQLACQLFELDQEWLSSRLEDEDHPDHDKAFNYRLIAKTSWFAVIYGSGAKKLLDILNIMGVDLTGTGDFDLELARAARSSRNSIGSCRTLPC